MTTRIPKDIGEIITDEWTHIDVEIYVYRHDIVTDIEVWNDNQHVGNLTEANDDSKDPFRLIYKSHNT